MAANSGQLLEDILNEDNIIQEDDDDIFTTQQTQMQTKDNLTGILSTDQNGSYMNRPSFRGGVQMSERSEVRTPSHY